MAESSKKKRKPVAQGWEIETVGGENQSYVVPDLGFLNKEENQEDFQEPLQPEPTPEQKTETAIDELRNRYMAELRAEYKNAADILRNERDEALRENWILQQQAKAALPEQLSAAGINGGAAETSLANLSADFQKSRNDIREDYFSELNELAGKKSKEKAEMEKSYYEKWLEYLMNIAQMEKKHEIEEKYG